MRQASGVNMAMLGTLSLAPTLRHQHRIGASARAVDVVNRVMGEWRPLDAPYDSDAADPRPILTAINATNITRTSATVVGSGTALRGALGVATLP